MPCRIAALFICHIKPNPDMEPPYIGTDFWGHARTPQNLGNIRSGSSIYAYNIPSSIACSSKVSSGSLSSGGGGVDVHGRDGSGHIESLTTYGLFNLVPVRLCVGVSLCIINNEYLLDQCYTCRTLTLKQDASTVLYE